MIKNINFKIQIKLIKFQNLITLFFEINIKYLGNYIRSLNFK